MEYTIDQQTDFSRKELYNFLSDHPLPEYVKEAAMDDLIVTGVSKEAFADSMGRKFPINSKVNVFVSNAFLTHKKADLQRVKGDAYVTKVEGQIHKAASVLGIEDDLVVYNAAAQIKLAEDYEDRTISVNLDGSEVPLFSIKTAEQLIDGVQNFVRDLDKFPYAWRRDISEQFVKAAEALEIDELPDIVVKYAGQFYPDIVGVKEEILRRSTKLAGEDKENYIKIAEDIDNACSKEEFFDLAEFCYQTEKKAGLYDKPYQKKVLGDPVDRFFSISLEKAAELLDTVTMGGERFATADLNKVSSDIFEKAFGFELDVKSAEAKEILPTMPKADVELFKQLSGVKPI